MAWLSSIFRTKARIEPCQWCKNVLASPDSARLVSGWVRLDGVDDPEFASIVPYVCQNCGVKWTALNVEEAPCAERWRRR